VAGPADATPKLFWPAVLCLLLGLASLSPLLIVAGLPALLLGLFCLRSLHRAEGRLRGAPLAVAGLILGGIGTLVSASGFVVSWVLEAREKANRAQCQNNLRLIGEAVNRYQEDHKAFPPAALPNAALEPEQRWSWLAGVGPFLQAKERLDWRSLDLKTSWRAEVNEPFVTVSITEFLCPSNGNRAPPGAPALTHYVGFAGVGADAARLPLSDPGAGFFGYDRELTEKALTELRGSSRTAIVTETAFENGPWAAGGPSTVRSLDPEDRPYLGPGRPLGGCHRTGANVLFADGSVNYFLNNFDSGNLETLVRLHWE
jgi:prepilin-type processing-associated H-X9-DG protein